MLLSGFHKNFFLFVIFFVVCFTVYANEKRHIISIAPEFGYSATLDEGYSPYPHSSILMGGKLGYDYRNPKIVNELSLQAKYGVPRPSYEDFFAPPDNFTRQDIFILFNLSDTVLFPVKISNFPLKLYFGGAFRMEGQILVDTGRHNVPYAIYFNLDGEARAEWSFAERQTLRFGLVLPILGMKFRPPWSGYYTDTEIKVSENGYLYPLFSDAQFSFWHNRQSAKMNLRYALDIYEWLGIFADYNFQFNFDNSIRALSLFAHTLNVGVEFKL